MVQEMHRRTWNLDRLQHRGEIMDALTEAAETAVREA